MNPQYSSKLSQFLFLLLAISILISCGSPQEKSPTTSGNLEATENSQDNLSSWEDGPKNKIMDWVKSTTTEGSTEFIPEKDRIAVFDNDGTLWSEQPYYFQLAFAIDEVKRLAPEHPEWKNDSSLDALIKGDMAGFMAGGEKALLTAIAMTHAGMTAEEFDSRVKNWIKTATHPKTGKHYNEMIFQPMLELLQYLRANGFKTFIVSGGGIDFMRAWTEEAYGIPPYQVVGSQFGLSYVDTTASPELIKIPELFFNDDKAGKPVGIYRNIGKRPVFAGGNSDGDYQMLQYTSTGDGARFGLIVHHTDSVREVAYDRESHIGQLNKGLDDAAKYNWLIVDMAKDWKVIYPYELK
ncbi:phosphoglycolate phosphatase-like HAD superfamily hydrolase [Algoriphagus iocasae]|uniref:Phosphoglycolate phosphatase-like HAD superfamily hydrolase n=1 Tax=Algoriphagus iocasae TaxID=1836499 RepID=A0A841MEL5_9BACT|nr:HAD family hydrolase [Algoriphagus iocasae]MBB6326542.1 phosphoglycolate phosphatase-like HAD superfamily hydrolase [Algoriphagus iocasae]